MPVTGPEFRAALKDCRSVVFFSSWCEQCRLSFKGRDSKNDIFVGVWDRCDKVVEVARTFLLPRCFCDDGGILSKKVQLSKVPFEQACQVLRDPESAGT